MYTYTYILCVHIIYVQYILYMFILHMSILYMSMYILGAPLNNLCVCAHLFDFRKACKPNLRMQLMRQFLLLIKRVIDRLRSPSEQLFEATQIVREPDD